MLKIGVVGDRDSVICFKAFGMDVFAAAEGDPEGTRKVVDGLARGGYGIIFITEQIAATIPETVGRYDRAAVPAVILIPGNAGSLGVGLERVQKNVERAVGINILDEGR